MQFGSQNSNPFVGGDDRGDLKDHGMVTGYFATTN
jgi:hypothetical protein